ncbi:hypothetical protein U9M48_043873 [Paspalum notatum var. saurae]|uniref:Major facilitator superfamily (MFS) profile domain-containing protein n=1 Tax=Paspalum notatum var. saurae TaxID=547442 RepID=A0AAQ3XIZ6_PASNO
MLRRRAPPKMPAGGFSVSSVAPPPPGTEFEAKITPAVVMSCVMAATGGLMFGYDIGVSGGVTSMDDFLGEFFPSVLQQLDGSRQSTYCKYDNQGLQLFTSSLYIAGLVATLFASYTTRRFGRRFTMRMAGILFVIGAIFNGSAQNLIMLIVGRIFLGFGVGFANQVIRYSLSRSPVPVGDVAGEDPRRAQHPVPAQHHHWHPLRRGLIIFSMGLEHFYLCAMCHYRIRPWGWRLSLSLAGVPGALLVAGALIVVETPNSLIERGRLEEGKAALKKIRGTDNVEPEFNSIVEASLTAHHGVKHPPFRDLLRRRNRPQLIVTVFLQIFQNLTGISAIMFYAPVLLQTLGFSSDASLYSAMITGAVNALSTLVSVYAVDRVGRRMLLLEGGAYMFLTQAAMAVVFRIKVTDEADGIDRAWATMVVAMVCTFVFSFAWSWGPLGWLIPSEIFPLDTRSGGQSVAVCANLLFTFVMGQTFLSMLCRLKYAIFAFFSGCIFLMSLFVFFFLPETKKVPIEMMTERAWRQHWFWKRFFMDDDDGNP